MVIDGYSTPIIDKILNRVYSGIIGTLMDKIVEDAVETAGSAGERSPKLFGVVSGVKGLDDMFFTVKLENGTAKKVPLGGYPFRSVINITGVPDTGKSLMAEQFAVKQASLGYKVCFVTVESPSAFVAQGLRQRCLAMGLEWEQVKDNIIMVDAATNSLLRDDLKTLLSTVGYAIEKYETKNLVIDSVTGLYEAREVLARIVVREIFNFAKRYGQTTIMISQKRSGHQPESAEAAGGYAVSHIVDGTIVLGKKLIQSRWDQKLYGMPVGEILRTIRIDGCRLCGHDTSTHILRILETGLVEVGPRLSEVGGGE